MEHKADRTLFNDMDPSPLKDPEADIQQIGGNVPPVRSYYSFEPSASNRVVSPFDLPPPVRERPIQGWTTTPNTSDSKSRPQTTRGAVSSTWSPPRQPLRPATTRGDLQAPGAPP